MICIAKVIPSAKTNVRQQLCEGQKRFQINFRLGCLSLMDNGWFLGNLVVEIPSAEKRKILTFVAKLDPTEKIRKIVVFDKMRRIVARDNGKSIADAKVETGNGRLFVLWIVDKIIDPLFSGNNARLKIEILACQNCAKAMEALLQ